jgi:hypothetical protein
MNSSTVIRLARPSFWPEARDPEAWLRALAELDRITGASDMPIAGPWSSWEHHLANLLPRRSVAGLFGCVQEDGPVHLWGVGLVGPVGDRSGWRLAGPARDVLELWRARRIGAALEALAAHLLRSSVWLRTVLIRLAGGDWRIRGWDRLRRGRGQLLAGTHLLMEKNLYPETWWSGIEREALGTWTDTLGAGGGPVAIEQDTSRELSWAPVRAPLELLDALGWWSAESGLQVPQPLAAERRLNALQAGRGTPSSRLRAATVARADIRGLSPLEPVLRDLAGTRETGPAFARWADALLGRAIDAGAIELVAAEPGQARHGRGLFGDRRRRLVRWHIHDDFDAIFNATPPPATSSNGRGPDDGAPTPGVEEDE